MVHAMKIEYVINAALLCTVMNYLILQAMVMRTSRGLAALFTAGPLLLWGVMCIRVLFDLRFDLTSHPFWQLELAAWTILATVCLFMFNWEIGGTNKKRRKVKPRAAPKPAPPQPQPDLPPILFRRDQLVKNLNAVNQLLSKNQTV